jgi:hypothetical protein
LASQEGFCSTELVKKLGMAETWTWTLLHFHILTGRFPNTIKTCLSITDYLSTTTSAKLSLSLSLSIYIYIYIYI